MSDTPRTEERLNSDAQFHDEVVDADFARNLKRELASCNEALARAMRVVEAAVIWNQQKTDWDLMEAVEEWEAAQ